MLNENLQLKISKDIQLKTLVNEIKNNLIASGKSKPEAISMTSDIINKNIDIIEEYLSKHIVCKDEPMSFCKQKNPGFEDTIFYENGQFYLGFKKCANWNHDHKNETMLKQFKFIDYDIDEFNLAIDEFIEQLNNDKDIFNEKQINDRKFILQEGLNKIYKYNNKNKGVYLFGNPGVGKTTLMKVIANTVAKQKNKTIVFIAVPNLINSVKDSFNKKQYKNVSLLDRLKKADILFLDDIGGENVTNWSRDDLLFSILNYRMENSKITFFTSNFDLNELMSNYKVDSDIPSVEKIKQKRFMERIKALSDVYKLDGNSNR